MRTKLTVILIALFLASFMLVPASAKQYGAEPWPWAKVKHTEIDFKAMQFLWSSWVLPENGKVAILPFSDYSDETMLATPYGGTATYAARRLAESIGYEFTRIGLKPLPYDDCQAAVENLVAARDPRNPSEASVNNAYHLGNKTAELMGAIREQVPSLIAGLKSLGEGPMLSKDDIKALGETLGADLILRGSISEFGMQSKHEANWRTFIPPFLGLFSREKEGMIEATVYMYDAHSGELVWVVYEEVEADPDLPYFSTNFEIMDSAETLMALRVVSHLVMPPPPPEMIPGPLYGEPEDRD